MSSKLGKNKSHKLTAWRVQACARASGHSDKRKFESSATRVPMLRACCMAAKAVSQAELEIASEMPDRSSHWLRAMASCQCARSVGCMRLAADPARA